MSDQADIEGAAIDGPPDGGRRLVLLRHAKSDWPDVADHDRPLAKRGRRDAPAVGRWLGQSGYAPDAVICSTALRARETWELASAGLQTAVPGAAPAVRYESRVYEATVLGLLMLVREFPPQWRTALLVGHNPGMAELTARPRRPVVRPAVRLPDRRGRGSGACPVRGPTPPRARPSLLAFAIPADMRSE